VGRGGGGGAFFFFPPLFFFGVGLGGAPLFLAENTKKMGGGKISKTKQKNQKS